MSIRVLLVDDQELIREGLSIILDAQPDIEVVGCAAHGRQAIEMADQHHPNVVLMDIRMPIMDGIEATRRIKESQPATQILILTTYDQDDLVFAGIRAGASGYLLKDITRDELADAVRGASRGEAQLDPSAAAQVLQEFRRMAQSLIGREESKPEPVTKPRIPDSLPEMESLTPREETILQLLTVGLTNAGIASQLHLSEGTVKNYVSEIISKLHANDRTHAVVLAIRRGLLDISE